jgi:general nucleoside transport system permease protein
MSFWVDSLSTGVVLGTPLAYAAAGELIAERSGVVNLGVEGMMLIGAVVGFVVGVKTGSVPLAFIIAALAGGVLAAVHGVMTINLRTNQIVMGLTRGDKAVTEHLASSPPFCFSGRRARVPRRSAAA